MTGIGVTNEQPILFADSGGANGVFDEVVIDLDLTVFAVTRQAFPLIQGLGAGDTETGFGQGAVGEFEDNFFKQRQGQIGMAVA